jgi:hypothetical protein
MIKQFHFSMNVLKLNRSKNLLISKIMTNSFDFQITNRSLLNILMNFNLFFSLKRYSSNSSSNLSHRRKENKKSGVFFSHVDIFFFFVYVSRLFPVNYLFSVCFLFVLEKKTQPNSSSSFFLCVVFLLFILFNYNLFILKVFYIFIIKDEILEHSSVSFFFLSVCLCIYVIQIIKKK